MRRALLGATVIVGLTLAGCTHAPSNEDAFYTVMQSTPDFAGWGQDGLTNLANSVCDTFAAAGTTNAFPDTVHALTKEGVSDGGAILFVAASVSAYCPEYRDQVPDKYLD